MYFKLTVTVILIVHVATTRSQNEADPAFLLPGYEIVTDKPPESLGAIERCGEGESQGKTMCVPYYQCDSETNTIILDGRTDGFGIIDIRFGEDSPCEHYLDVCCKIPEGGIPPTSDISPTPIEPTKIPVSVPTEEPTPKPDPDLKPGISWLCGLRNDNGIDFKITGNNDHEAEYGEFPWMAAIVKTHPMPSNDNILICGASLITANVVLTGAHCVYSLKTDDMKVRVGEWDTQTEKERLPFQERAIKEVIVHENFRPQVLFNDVALLILESPLDEAEHIGSICLPEQGQVFNSKECVATGWGKDKFGHMGEYQAILKKITLPTVPKDICQEKLRTTRLGKYFILDKSFMCAGGEKGRDTCTGDGGSPLVCPDPNQPNRYVQAGLVAWGIGCGEEIPAVYGDVAQFRTWIDTKLSSLGDNRI